MTQKNELDFEITLNLVAKNTLGRARNHISRDMARPLKVNIYRLADNLTTLTLNSPEPCGKCGKDTWWKAVCESRWVVWCGCV